MPSRDYYVYILSSVSRTLYVGVTSDLQRQIAEHKQKMIPGFSKQYNISRLVYYETTQDVFSAIERKKQIKGWRRNRKKTLIESANPDWNDLSEGW